MSTWNYFPLYIVCHIWNLFSPELFNLFSCGDHVFHDLGSLQFDGLVNEDGSEFFCPNPIASLRSSIKCLLKIFGDPGGRVLIYHAGFQSQHCIKPGRVVWPEGRRIKSPRLSSATWRVQGQSGLRKTVRLYFKEGHLNPSPLVMEIVPVEDRLRSHPEKNVHEPYTV